MSSRCGGEPRAGESEENRPPLYARVLRLKHIHPGPWSCFLFCEGSLAVAGVLLLADWVSSWGLLVLPIGVAIAVKLNDVVTGALPPAGAANARSTTNADKKSRSASEVQSDSKMTAGSATSAAGRSTADDGAETTMSSGEAAGSSANESKTADNETAENQAEASQTADNGPEGSVPTGKAASGNSGSGDSASGNAAGRDSGSGTSAPGNVPGDSSALDNSSSGSAPDIRAAEDPAAEDNAAGGWATSERAAAARGNRDPITATSAWSRATAGTTTTAPPRSGSAPLKDEG